LELPDDGGGMSLALEVRIFLTRVFYAWSSVDQNMSPLT
jgi:hypothetical protein